MPNNPYAPPPAPEPELRADSLPCNRDVARRMSIAKANGTRMEPTPYDVLTEKRNGPAATRALAEAKALCRGCPIADTCLPAKRDAGEQWAKLVLDGIKSTYSEANRKVHRNRARLRTDTLRSLVDQGGTVADATVWLKMSPTGLRLFCRREGLMDLWQQLRGHEFDQREQQRKGRVA